MRQENVIDQPIYSNEEGVKAPPPVNRHRGLIGEHRVFVIKNYFKICELVTAL